MANGMMFLSPTAGVTAPLGQQAQGTLLTEAFQPDRFSDGSVVPDLPTGSGGMADATKMKIAGAAMIGAAKLSQGLAQRSNLFLQNASIARRQEEVGSRADIAIANILQMGEKVQARQETTFAKAGVKMEGSALNVLAETAGKAVEAARVKQRERDFEISQMERMRAVNEVSSKFAMFNTILGAASSAGSAFAMGGK
jgi:hypothetical protein